jgi:hypothetical protein
MTSGSKNTILGRYQGNSGGLDIRTSSNNIVLSDGDGNPRVHIDGSGHTTCKQSVRFSNDGSIAAKGWWTGDFDIDISGLYTLSGNAWHDFGLTFWFCGVEGGQSNGTNGWAFVRLRGLSTWGAAVVYVNGGAATITVVGSSSTGLSLRVTNPSSSARGSAFVELSANSESRVGISG